MSAPLPSALRMRFREYIEEGLSGRAAAARLNFHMQRKKRPIAIL